MFYLFTIYFIVLSVALAIRVYRLLLELLMNNELDTMWKEAAII
jgi:hypothetical protein